MSQKYLFETYDFNNEALVSALDEFSLWSAPFGLKLLECIHMKKNLKVLDIGFGTGFPLIEIAQRLGNSCTVIGIDPWESAIERAKQKITTLGVSNIAIKIANAEAIPYPDQHFDLIVSNNGLNNVEDLDKSLSECYRVSKPGCQMVITMNLPDTFIEFYNVFRKTLTDLGLEKYHKAIDDHIFDKRKPLDFLRDKIANHGFTLINEHLSSFAYKFTDGTALLNYSFFKICFLDGWKHCVPENQLIPVFQQLEFNLNSYASNNNGIELSVPFVCFDIKKNK